MAIRLTAGGESSHAAARVRARLAPVALALAACGRVGFDARARGDARGGDAGDGPGSSDATDGAACSAITAVDWLPTKMPVDAAKLYAPSTDGMTVVDEVTGLLWQRNVDPGLYTVAQAEAYCAALTLNSCTQWRLPQRVELATLVDHQFTMPVIDPVAFPSTPIDQPFWTATANTSASNNWLVNFYNGNTNWNAVTQLYYVRCVHAERAGTPPPGRYQLGVSAVLDVETQLAWSPSAATFYTQSGGAAYCASLATDGGGWRLPEVGELETIVDTSRASPAVDPNAFSDTSSTYYWSSSSYGTGAGMVVDFTSGNIINASPTAAWAIRCVK